MLKIPHEYNLQVEKYPSYRKAMIKLHDTKNNIIKYEYVSYELIEQKGMQEVINLIISGILVDCVKSL